MKSKSECKLMNRIKTLIFFLLCFITTQSVFSQSGKDIFNGHKVKLDNQSKIVSWIEPQSKAY